MTSGWICALALMTAAAGAATNTMSYLDNGRIRLGVDLAVGGAVTFLADSRTGVNRINSWDWGRQVQLSFYSGPIPFQPPGTTLAPEWKGLGWNPIQAGDHYRNGSKVIEHRNDGTNLFVRCIPMIWPLSNVAAECTFEVTYTLEENAVLMRSRLINHRSDTTQYPGRGQELPAVYVNGPWCKLVSYLGDKPGTGEPVTVVCPEHNTKGWPWRKFYASERWAALVDTNGDGVGVFHPTVSFFSGGFAGQKGVGGPTDGPTGYATPLAEEILDHNIDYRFDSALIVGRLDDIRAWALKRVRFDKLPQWTFESDRQSWFLVETTDAGWPVRGALEVKAKPGAALVSPYTWWKAESASRLVIEAAATGSNRALTVWLDPVEEADRRDWPAWGPGGRPPEGPWRGPVQIELTGDGAFHRYEAKLDAVPDYRGAMKRMKIVLPTEGGPVKVKSVSLLK